MKVWKASKASDVREIAVTNQAGEIEHRCVRISKDDKSTWQQNRDEAQLTALVCQAIDDNLQNAVAYRRRDFENDAMMRELCRRNGIVLPEPGQTSEARSEQPVEDMRGCLFSPRSVATPTLANLTKLNTTFSRQKPLGELGNSATTTHIYVIYCNESGAQMFADIQAGIEEATSPGRVALSTNNSDLIGAVDRVLLLLSDGVLTDDDSIQQLNTALHNKGGELLSVVYDEESWEFGCPAQQRASDIVKTCLETHEALTYRPRDPHGWLRHEHPSMIHKLLLLLGVLGCTDDDYSQTVPRQAVDKEHIVLDLPPSRAAKRHSRGKTKRAQTQQRVPDEKLRP